VRLIAGLLGLILVFAVLLRLTPSGWGLPLYLVFVAVGIVFTLWERRGIGRRRQELEQELQDERRRWQEERRRRQAQQDPNGNERETIDR
jgi:protein-S-isoprenylcysteine O-methyltransferase Ste14